MSFDQSGQIHRCDALAEWISESTCLACLNLSDTDLRDTGCLRVSRGMKDAPHFEELRLSKNRLTTQVHPALQEVIDSLVYIFPLAQGSQGGGKGSCDGLLCGGGNVTRLGGPRCLS